ncbi:hypothetical protein E2C01_022186 [Portunus trituberculatus]|uniref:Uncharacterized protein n=1 Tax=Portunus trituberculatus TaxID=210409 RepID=A0A5B7E4Q3_PORTR|nr:hypothetical protein [Portunus trituberculatus]
MKWLLGPQLKLLTPEGCSPPLTASPAGPSGPPRTRPGGHRRVICKYLNDKVRPAIVASSGGGSQAASGRSSRGRPGRGRGCGRLPLASGSGGRAVPLSSVPSVVCLGRDGPVPRGRARRPPATPRPMPRDVPSEGGSDSLNFCAGLPVRLGGADTEAEWWAARGAASGRPAARPRPAAAAAWP